MDVNTDEVTTISVPHQKDSSSFNGDNPAAATADNSGSTPMKVIVEEAAVNLQSMESQQEETT